MKYQITNIYEAKDDMEIEQVKEAKAFSKGVLKLSGTLLATLASTGLFVAGIEDFATIPFAFGMVMASASSAATSFQIANLYNIYKQNASKDLKSMLQEKDNYVDTNNVVLGGGSR